MKRKMEQFLEYLSDNKVFIIESVYCFFSSYGFYHFTNNLLNRLFFTPLNEIKETGDFTYELSESSESSDISSISGISGISGISSDFESFQEIKKRKRE